jgi:hypothetical protein
VNRFFDMPGKVDGRPCPFQLDNQSSLWRPMQQGVEIRHRLADLAANRQGNCTQGFVEPGPDALKQIAAQLIKRPSKHFAINIEELRSIRAGLNHDMVGFADHEQSAMRLNRPGQLDLFALAIGKIGFSKSRWRAITKRHAVKPPGIRKPL